MPIIGANSNANRANGLQDCTSTPQVNQAEGQPAQVPPSESEQQRCPISKWTYNMPQQHHNPNCIQPNQQQMRQQALLQQQQQYMQQMQQQPPQAAQPNTHQCQTMLHNTVSAPNNCAPQKVGNGLHADEVKIKTFNPQFSMSVNNLAQAQHDGPQSWPFKAADQTFQNFPATNTYYPPGAQQQAPATNAPHGQQQTPQQSLNYMHHYVQQATQAAQHAAHQQQQLQAANAAAGGGGGHQSSNQTGASEMQSGEPQQNYYQNYPPSGQQMFMSPQMTYMPPQGFMQPGGGAQNSAMMQHNAAHTHGYYDHGQQGMVQHSPHHQPSGMVDQQGAAAGGMSPDMQQQQAAATNY